MKKIKMRSAFSMLTAIFLIVIMATISVFVMSLSGKVVKATTAQFQHEQAVLYAKSYTEYAILAVTGHDRSSNCLQTVTGTISAGGGYSIRTHIAYIASASELGSCVDAGGVSLQLNNAALETTDTPLTIIIDAYVDYSDLDNPSGPLLTVHRRTVQKI